MIELDGALNELVIANRILANEDVVDAYGHVSIRHPGNPERFFMACMLAAPEMVERADLMEFSLDGQAVNDDRTPSIERFIHCGIYEARPEVQAVVHAHPPTATGFAVAGIPLDRAVLAEVLTTLGSIPIAEYATPSTRELPEAVRKYIKAHDGMLLANHGALTVGADLYGAYYKMETIEHFAKISLVARLLGRENLLSREEVMRLQELRGSYGIQAPAPICAIPGTDLESRSVPELTGAAGDATCQTVQAPKGDGSRLVADVVRQTTEGREDEEIRLTYRELSALLEDAIRSLR